MTPLRIAAAAVPLVLVGAGVFAFASYRSAMAEAEKGYAAIASRAQAPRGVFEEAMIADLPEIAQRYFRHAIAPGTPLRTTARLEMEGIFLLGDRKSHQTYRMKARQILRPPFEFVWIAHMSSGPMRVSGSDALVGGSAWTRFWLMGMVPAANELSSPDLVRSAAFRAASEATWVPAALLPQNGVRWEAAGPDRARVHILRANPEIVLELLLGPDGAVREIAGQRWSNANPDRVFRLQPFGGTVEAEATFEGFTIPSVVHVGNHFGTADYLPFFQARITRATYR